MTLKMNSRAFQLIQLHLHLIFKIIRKKSNDEQEEFSKKKNKPREEMCISVKCFLQFNCYPLI